MRTALRTRALVGALALVTALAGGNALAQFSNPRPIGRASDEYLALVMKGAYADLDRAVEDLQRSAPKLSDGQPRLAALYEGISGSNRFTEELWGVLRQRLEEWRTRNPKSTTAKIASAALPLRHAWFVRGGGAASTVSQSAWKIFEKGAEESRVALNALDGATKENPGWFDAMLDVARAQHWPADRFDAQYEEAVRKQPDYLPLYFKRAAYYSPQWYGSVEDLRRVIEEMVARAQPLMREVLYARLHWAMSTNEMFDSGRTDWTRMKAGFEGLIRDYPDPWNVNNYARFACMAQDWRTLERLSVRIGDKPIAMAWYGDGEMYAKCLAHGKNR
jgi:hypothetical protein